MVNKPRRKGTAAETAVVTYLRDHGWPYAERRSLNGALDKGDVTGCPGLCFEVKAAGVSLKMSSWLGETGVEAINATADFGILVVKPPGVGETRVHQWYAIMRGYEFDRLLAVDRNTELSIVHRDPVTYTEKALRYGVTAAARRSTPEVIEALTLRPPKTQDKPEAWYRVITLENMTLLLRAAGYGTPPEVQWQPASPGDTPGELVPGECDPPQPLEALT